MKPFLLASAIAYFLFRDENGIINWEILSGFDMNSMYNDISSHINNTQGKFMQYLLFNYVYFLFDKNLRNIFPYFLQNAITSDLKCFCLLSQYRRTYYI